MIKTVALSGKELKAEGLGGFNTVVHNLSGGAIYASKYPNIVPGADDVAEIPLGSSKLISTTNGTVYLLGTGKAELTGQDCESVNSSGGGGAVGGDGSLSAVIDYVNEQDAINLEASKTYTDDKLADKADRSEIPTTLPANGGNAAKVNGHTVNADVPSNAKFTDTTYTNATTTKDGLMSGADKSKLDSIANGANNYVHPTTAGNKHIPAGGSTGQILRWSADGTAAWGEDTNTTYSDFVKSGSGAKSGLVPSPGTTAGTTKYLREDGTWQTPPNTTYSAMTGATASAAGKSGLVPAPPAGNLMDYLNAGGEWKNPFRPTRIETAGTDANTYVTPGIYFFYSTESPLNAPISGINGWLIVFGFVYGEIKQMWFRLGGANSTDSDTFIRTKVSGGWSNWRKVATVPAATSPMQVVGITQGTLNSVTTTLGTSYIPYQSGATKALVEIWKTASNFNPNFSATSYGGRYITGLSSSMTAVSNVTVFSGVLDTATVGADSTGRIAVGGSVGGDDDTHYRVTWFV